MSLFLASYGEIGPKELPQRQILAANAFDIETGIYDT
jgi:hypothetical protein